MTSERRRPSCDVQAFAGAQHHELRRGFAGDFGHAAGRKGRKKFEQAGGAASTGTERVLDLQPTSLHQKVPLIIGSRDDVAEYNKFYKDALVLAAD